jgi:hypothetical protein
MIYQYIPLILDIFLWIQMIRQKWSHILKNWSTLDHILGLQMSSDKNVMNTKFAQLNQTYISYLGRLFIWESDDNFVLNF